MRKLPSMACTEKALAEYDARPQCPPDDLDNDGVLAWFDDDDKAGEAVARAFAADTADRNSLGHCIHMRPGPATPSPGSEPSYMRRMVAAWKQGF